MSFSKFLMILLPCIIFTSNIHSKGFLKVKGISIVDETNQDFYLKGIGLGGWLLQEGYMLKTSGFANAEYQIRERIVDLIGEERTIEFYEKYWANYVREIDIKNIADWGFNSVRLPMHFNKMTDLSNTDTYFEKGFETIDTLLAWCKKYELYLILDLHAAPGGQSDENISDYNPDYPSLWESEINKEITIKLWKKLAERYADEKWIGGYDLLNEPKWDLGEDNIPLRELYIEITKAIREVDTNHIIYIEGNWFATNFKGLTPAWDDNMVYSFHKYWNPNNKEAIQSYLALREETQKPLWLGETGENSNTWFLDCVNLMKEYNIGWAWWPHKKIDNIAGPLSAELIPQYQTLLDFWNGKGDRPTSDFAYDALMKQTDKLLFENCKFQPDVIDALMRQSQESLTIPFKKHNLPGRIFAVDYDLGKLGDAYFDVEYHNIGIDGARKWNNDRQYRNDGVDIAKCDDEISNGYKVGWIDKDEFLKYTVDVSESGNYNIIIRYFSDNESAEMQLLLNDEVIIESVPLIPFDGKNKWRSIELQNVNLSKGTQSLIFFALKGGYNLNYFDFVLKSSSEK